MDGVCKTLKMLTTLFVYFGLYAPAVQLDSATCIGATAVPWLQVPTDFSKAEVSGHSRKIRISALSIFAIYCFG